jgi:hypothetical protein
MVVARTTRTMAKDLLFSADDFALEPTLPPTRLEIPCPGKAHARGEICLICDPETDGRIEVFVTSVERDALHCAAHGLPFDATLARRLVRLGLLAADGAGWSTTAAGLALIATRRNDLH